MASKDPLLFDSFEIRGFWWVPGNEDHKVPGQISFAPESGLKLDVLGSLLPNGHLSSRFYHHTIILGDTDNGRPCTLVQNTPLHRDTGFGKTIKELYQSQYFLIGKHFPVFEMINYSYIDFGCTHLEDWVDQYPFGGEWNENGETSVTLSIPKVIVSDIQSINTKIELQPSTFHNSVRHKHEMGYTYQIRVRPQNKQHIGWFWEIILEIRNIFSLMMVRPTYFRQVTGFIKSEEKNKSATKVGIYFAGRHAAETDEPNFDMLLTYPQINTQFPKMLDIWLSSIEILGPLRSLFFGYLDRPDMHVHFRFLSLMQALESYHRATRKGIYVDTAEYEKYRQAITNAIPSDIPPDLKTALKDRLKYGNEYSLRRRLKELFELLEPKLQHLVDQDYKAFIKQVVDDRNYLTHYDQETKPEKFSSQKLVFTTQKLAILLTILLLKYLELDSDTIHEAVKKNRLLWPWQ